MDKIFQPEILLKPCSISLFDVSDEEVGDCLKLKKAVESDSTEATSSDEETHVKAMMKEPKVEESKAN